MKTNFRFQILTQALRSRGNLFVLALFFVCGSSWAQSYCVPSGVCLGNPNGNTPFFIESFFLVNNYSTSITADQYFNRFPDGTGCAAGGYIDYRSRSPVSDVWPGAALTMLVGLNSQNYQNSGFPFLPASTALWIDFNKDGVFNKTNEVISISSVGLSSQLVPINVPAGTVNFGKVNCRF